MRVSEAKTIVFIADPAWPHANGSRTNSGKSPKYPLMTLAQIAALGSVVKAEAGEHSVMALWATAPHLPGAIETLKAFGFKYRSFRIWRKRKMACGFWVRSDAEIVLIGERGKPAPPRKGTLRRTIFDGDPITKEFHSSKPGELHKMIELSWPESQKIELFATRETAGWKCYGTDLGYLITPTGIVPLNEEAA